MTPYQKRVTTQGRGKKHRQLYNLWFNSTTHDLEIELEMIRAGGQWEKADGTKAGNGLSFHYKRVVEIIWPEIKQHRWFTKFLETWLEHKYIGVLGPASSGKTLNAAICHLVDYYAFPHNTTILICSTTKESLENRIWGEIKKWHRMARERFRWLTGNLIEGRTRLVTDHRDDAEEGRDFRNGIIGVPLKKGNVYVGMSEFLGIKNERMRLCGDELQCLVGNSLIDTPSGQVEMRHIHMGDYVMCANGRGRVRTVFSRTVDEILRVSTRDGRTFYITAHHPVFTQFGWKKAFELNQSHYILSTYEAMSIMHGSVQTEWKPKGVQQVLGSEGKMRLLSHTVYTESTALPTEVLQSALLGEMEGVDTGNTRQDVLSSVGKETGEGNEAVLGFPSGTKRKVQSKNVEESVLEITRCWSSDLPGIKSGGTQTDDSGWKRDGTNKSRVGAYENVSQRSMELWDKNRQMERKRVSSDLQGGLGISTDKVGHRSRRRNTRNVGQPKIQRQEEGKVSKGSWVDSVKVFKQGDIGFPETGGGSGGCRVYNLEIEGHPSYSVDGLLVHNCCPKSFLDVTVNLSGNRDFKATGMGNPADTLDALGLLCEPHPNLGGWESGIDQTLKTKTWATRFENGVCLQLPGSDCPNMDAPDNMEVPYPFLITRQKMRADADTWGKDDWHYKMFDEGMMPRGQGSRRVITRQLCIKHGAMEVPVWRNHIRTKIGFLDAAYRAVGGDRCVFGELDFGEERDDEMIMGEALAEGIINQRPPGSPPKTILALISMSVIPIEAFAAESPEDQIVAFVKKQCEDRGIPPNNFFFDSGMRTSLVTSFSRLWSNMVNPIDCGGRPTERIVSDNINIMCCDYYSKFITEMWYSVRLIIECGQFRGMTEDVMQEGCSREWKTVGANKIEVETKADMKEKTGRSPDLFDALAVGCEGARRLGFVIRKLANKEYVQIDDGWKRDLRHKAHDRFKAKQLVHSV